MRNYNIANSKTRSPSTEIANAKNTHNNLNKNFIIWEQPNCDNAIISVLHRNSNHCYKNYYEYVISQIWHLTM